MKTLKGILFTVLIVFSGRLYSQSLEIIEIDSISNTPKKTLPFDEPFILKLKQSKRPNFILVAEHKGNKTLVQSINEMQFIKGFKNISESNYWVKGGYLYIKFDYSPYKEDNTEKKNNILKPSKNYSILISEQNDDFYIVYKNLYLCKIIKKDSVKYYNKALKIYEDNLNSQQDNLGFTFLGTPDSLYNISKSYDTLFQQLDTLEKKYQPIIYSKSPFNSLTSLQNAVFFVKSIDTTKINWIGIDKPDFFEMSVKLYNMQDSDLVKVMTGKATLKNNLNEIKEITYSENNENYNNTIKQIESYEVALDKLAMLGFSDPINLKKLLSQMKDNIIKNRQNLQPLLSQEKKIKQYINNKNMYEANHIQNIGSSTIILDFEKRCKFQITPDFGWVGFGFQKNFNGFSPYLGFHINFRYINKDIPFSRLPNKTILHYLSFMTAWSLTSISEEGKRKDFFTNSTLLTGVGIRLSNAIRITGGVNWFYKLDPNPTISKKSIAVTPYIGLSVDLDVKQFLNGFTDLKLQK